MKLANLGKRLLFVAWAVPLGWWVVNADVSLAPRGIVTVYPGHLLATLLAVLACYEYVKMLRIQFPANGFWLGYVWLLLQIVLHLLGFSARAHLWIYTLFIVVAIEAFVWGRGDSQSRWPRASLFCSGIAYLYVAALSMIDLYNEPFQSMFRSFGHSMLSQLGIVIVVSAVFLCDSCAYLIGSAWGRHHFSSVSPKKTVEGSIAGLAAALLTAGIGWYFLGNQEYPRWLGLAIGLIIGVFAQVGDLFVSLMKRHFKVKDASDIIPGHGGILDRFDSIFFTIPALMLFFWLITGATP